MNVFALYLLLCKAMISSFSGATSLPVVRHEMVEHYHVLTDRQLEVAVAAGRITPGPFGLYLVSVGYFVDGVPGAIAGFLALITPAFLIIPMLRYLGRHAEKPRIKSAIRAVTLAASGLLIATTVPMAQDSARTALTIAVAAGSFLFLVLTDRTTFWVVIGAALVGLIGYFVF
ncbi:MAG: chromate transporter [Terriglobia bacterium]